MQPIKPSTVKTYSRNSLNPVVPKTHAQEDVMRAFYSGAHVALLGSSGSGKTYLAMYLALQEFLTDNTPLVVVRSATAVRDIGFLPGDLAEKTAVYELPYVSLSTELLGHKKAWGTLKNMGCSFVTTSFLRGVTLDHSVVLVDECQNLTFHELDSIVSRLGVGSRLILCGDTAQSDIRDSGLKQMMTILEPLIAVTTFTAKDILRSEFVKSYLMRKESLGY